MPHLKGHKFSHLLFIHFVIWYFFTIMYGVSLHSTVNAGTSWNFWWYSFYNAYLAQVFQMNIVCSTENIANAHYNNLLLAIHKTWLSVSYFSIITGEGSSYHAYKSLQTAFSSAQDDKSNSLQQIKEHRIHCIMLYILSQYFLICFNYLE
jgi:hypothetical protein